MRKEKKYTNNDLIEGVYNKNSDIIKYIINECYPAIEKLVLSNSGNKEDADEVFQEALIVLFRKIRNKDFTLSSSIGTYLYSIGKHKWLQELRRKKPLEDLSNLHEEDTLLSEDTIQVITKNERIKLFRQKYEELSSDCRKVLRMFLMKVPLSEITKIMGYSSEQIARNRRYKCKESLINKIRNTTRFKELGYENITKS